MAPGSWPSRSRGLSRPAGVGLLVVFILLLIWGLRFARGGDHPLSAQARIDLCPLIERELAGLPERTLPALARIPEFAADAPGASCYQPLADGPPEQRAERHVWVQVQSRRMLAGDGARPETGRIVEVFLKETSASGLPTQDLAGPWKHGGLIRQRGAAPEWQLIADDDGIVLWAGARGVEPEQLTDFAGRVARRLREARP